MIQLEHDGNKFEWWYDSLYGVGYFARKSDDAITLWETGERCAQVRRDLNRAKTNTGAKKYPKDAPTFQELLDYLASQYEYDIH